jgi:molybdate transport system substrate-binding protein
VVVFAASSLKNAFTTIAADFEKAHPGAKVVSSFAGSDALATQISQGAPVDVFAAASLPTMAGVTAAGDAKGALNFARNQLEIAVPPGNPRHIASLSDVVKPDVKLALCALSVPCGAAATKVFAATALTPHPATLQQDVAAVLTTVELGEVDAGLVYVTDVLAAGAKVEGVPFPEAAKAVNTYPIAVVNTGHNHTAAQAFVDFVLSPEAQQVLRDAGFQQP